MKVIIDRRLNLQERSDTVLVRDAEIWTYGAQTRHLQRYSGLQERALASAAPLPSISVEDRAFSAEDVALTWDGSHILVAERSKRLVFQVDPASGQAALVMEPASLAFGDYDTALMVPDTVVGDIAWHDGVLYLAVQAGYSSAIYGVDLEKQQVISYRRAPGPKPWGLDFDPLDGALYTVDTRNRELRRFSNTGTMDVADLPVEWREPRGLSFDSDRGLWSADGSAGDVLRLRVEG